MANDEDLARLRQGAVVWNDWRAQNPERAVDLSGANLVGADLQNTDLSGANLVRADFTRATLVGANLNGAILAGAIFARANLVETNLIGANLIGAKLGLALLLGTDLRYADLTGCWIYGISAWDLKLEGAIQRDLVITLKGPQITVDNLEVAQFIYLLLHNEKIRDVIDTITSKVVLILGRFTPQRKVVLDALREELRKRNYLPVLFDFTKPDNKDLTGTVSTLAHMARFIIADLTDPSSIPHELATVIPSTVVPVQPVLLAGKIEYAMFVDLRKRHPWVLSTYHYTSPEQLIADIGERVINPAEAKVRELRSHSS